MTENITAKLLRERDAALSEAGRMRTNLEAVQLELQAALGREETCGKRLADAYATKDVELWTLHAAARALIESAHGWNADNTDSPIVDRAAFDRLREIVGE